MFLDQLACNFLDGLCSDSSQVDLLDGLRGLADSPLKTFIPKSGPDCFHE
jgi:hypothetical protein